MRETISVNLFRQTRSDSKMKILELLNWGTDCLRSHEITNPRLHAELLLGRALKVSREVLYTRLHDPCNEEVRTDFERLVGRRITGEPLQYILGYQEFWSIPLKVDRRVLIPRPETELLVEQALPILSERGWMGIPRVLEIGTGSGAVAISLANEIGRLFIVATDISPEALLLARENARLAGVFNQVLFVGADLFGPFRTVKGKEPFDLIVSNPPYVPRFEIAALPREVRSFEPIGALDGGEDGMDFYRKIISQGPSYLRRGGWLLLEVGAGQAEAVSEMIEKEGSFNKPERIKDFSGIERVLRAQRKG